jgi:hypothetical protein
MTQRLWDGFLTATDRTVPVTSRTVDPLAVASAAVLHVQEMPARRPAAVEQRIAALLDAAAAGGRRLYEVGPASGPGAGPAASAFFGTSLLTQLVRQRVSTLVVCGDSVSGRLRASVVDAVSYGLSVVVVEDCAWDPVEASRAIGLFDLHRLYGPVLGTADVLTAWGLTSGTHERLHEGGAHRHAHGDGRHGHSHNGAPHAHSHAADPDETTPLPPAVLAALPRGATPTATAHHPVHGHVLARAGDSVLDAVRDAMERSFADVPHTVVTLRRPDVEGSPDLERALDQTAGGVLVVGVAYEQHNTFPAPALAAPSVEETCPECGAPAAGVEAAPSTTGGQATSVYVCCDCGAAWDV